MDAQRLERKSAMMGLCCSEDLLVDAPKVYGETVLKICVEVSLGVIEWALGGCWPSLIRTAFGKCIIHKVKVASAKSFGE